MRRSSGRRNDPPAVPNEAVGGPVGRLEPRPKQVGSVEMMDSCTGRHDVAGRLARIVAIVALYLVLQVAALAATVQIWVD